MPVAEVLLNCVTFMEMHQHDFANCFRFVLRGEMTKEDAQQLWWAWETAQSVLHDRPVTVEVSGVTAASASVLDVLSQMRASGVRITAVRPVLCETLVHRFDLGSVILRARQHGKSGLMPMLKRVPALVSACVSLRRQKR